MPTISEIRQQYPQYQDLSDEQIAQGLHKKFYSDMDFGDFSQRIGLQPAAPVAAPAQPAAPTLADAKNQAMGELGTFLNNAGQGLTFNLMDEGQDLLGAAGAKLYDSTLGNGVLANKDYYEVYSDARAASQERLKRQMQENPGYAIAGQLTGAVMTGAAGAGTKVGKAIGDSLRTGGLGVRTAKAGLLGSASGGASGFNAGSGFEDRLASSRDGAVVGGTIAGAVPVAGKLAAFAVSKLTTPKAPISTADDVAALANQAYQKADQVGGTLSSQLTDDFLNRVGGLKPKSVAGQTVPIDGKFREVVDFVDNLRGKDLSLQDAQTLDEYLGDAIDSFTEMGRVNKTGQKLLTMQRELRNVIEGAQPGQISGGTAGFEALKEGRQLWAAQMKLRDIEKIISRAENMQNPAQSIKTGFNTLLHNAKKTRGYTKEELKLIEKAANTGVFTDILQTVGSRLNPIITGAAGGGLGATAAATAASTAARSAATKMQVNKALNVAREVSKRAAPKAAPQSTSRLPAVLSTPNAGMASVPIGQFAGSPKEGLGGKEPVQPLRLTIRPRSLLGN